MRHTHVVTGPRFPALRTLAFVLRAVALVAFAAGAWSVAGAVRQAEGLDPLLRPDHRDVLLPALARLGAGVLASLVLLALAELVVLFIQIERNTRTAAAAFAPAPLPDDELDEAPLVAPAPKAASPRGSRLPWLEGDEPSEGSLLRG